MGNTPAQGPGTGDSCTLLIILAHRMVHIPNDRMAGWE